MRLNLFFVFASSSLWTATTAVDPNICHDDGVVFTCNVESPLTLYLGPDQTSTIQVQSSISCLADPSIGFDFQNPNAQNCTCSATLTDDSTGAVKECACAACPAGSSGAVSIDCAQANTDAMSGCPYIGCDGSCVQPPSGMSNLFEPTTEAPTKSAAFLQTVPSAVFLTMGSVLLL